ncbi:hypothetical protein [Lacrimispora sp. 38-1]|uniref:hypothetical protein n=1 Tax=Lacrimispora sp. 38-1 TaxID=3125778 RepID=UPI003CE8AF5C
MENKKNERFYAVCTSLVLTVLFFGIIFTNFSNETFNVVGDQKNLCYPSFMRLGFYLRRGIFSGVDISTFNGASEFFSRGNLTTMYPIAMLFAFIGDAFSIQYIMYSLMFALHFFVAFYFAQRLGTRFFGLEKHLSLLFACSCLMLYSYEIWYTGFALSTMLVVPLLYTSLSLLGENRKYNLLLYSIPYVMAFTTGYITISIILVGIVFLTTCIFIVVYTDKGEVFRAFVKYFSIILIAGLVCLIYYLQLYRYVSRIVQTSGNTLTQVWDLSLNLDDIWVVPLASYTPSFIIEQYDALTIGVVWTVALITVFVLRKRIKFDSKKRIFHNVLIGVNVLLLIIAFGNTTPVITWFYSLVPIFGHMHLPIRYMMITLPLLYLVVCIEISMLPNLKGQKLFKNLSIALVMIAITATIILKVNPQKCINTNLFILEIVLGAIVLFKVYENGWNNIETVLVWCVSLILTAGTSFYSFTVPNLTAAYRETDNIYYNSSDLVTLNNYLNNDTTKLLYRYVCIDEDKAITPYVPQNFSWLNGTERDISNYYGYELQLAWPKDYAIVSNGWFANVNWQYIKNTRGNFVILTPAYIEKNQQFLDSIIDWSKSDYYLSNGMRICTLKKYVPSYYAGNSDTLDPRTDALDNGYFYSPQLLNRDMTRFETDRSRYFYAEINSESESDVEFLPYASPYYKYYIDSQEVQPTISDLQAYLKVPAGKHEIKILYKNRIGTLGGMVIIGYYFLMVIYGTGVTVFSIMNKKRRIINK